MDRTADLITPSKTHTYRQQSYNNALFLLAVALVAAAQLCLVLAPKVGIYVNAIVLMIVVVLGLTIHSARRAFAGLTSVSVANIVVASIAPASNFATTVTYSCVLLNLALIYRFIFTLEQLPQHKPLGMRGYALTLPGMATLGCIVGIACYYLLQSHPLTKDVSLPILAACMVVFAFAEEIVLRGLIQLQSSHYAHPIVAATGAAILGTALAMGSNPSVTIPAAILLHATASFIYLKKQNLILTICFNLTTKLIYIALIAGWIAH